MLSKILSLHSGMFFDVVNPYLYLLQYAVDINHDQPVNI